MEIAGNRSKTPLRHLLAVMAASLLLAPALPSIAQDTDQSSLESAEDYIRDPDRQRSIPGPATRIQVDGQTYYYSAGYFFRREDDGYLRVEPPLGAELSFLPYGSKGFEIDGQRFYLSGTGTFYRYDPRRRTYTITTPPYAWRRYYNGDIVGSYEDRLNAYDDPVEIDTLRERSGIPRAYPPISSPDSPQSPPSGDVASGTAPLFEADRDRYRDSRRYDSRRPYANVRPERFDDRALLENACRQQASTAARRGSSLERQQLRLYQRAYRDCIQRYQRRR